MGESLPPESGFRIEVERATVAGGPPWRYEGLAKTPSTSYGVAAVVDGDGSVRVELPADAPSRLVQRVVQMVKSALGAGEAPQRIVKWKAER